MDLDLVTVMVFVLTLFLEGTTFLIPYLKAFTAFLWPLLAAMIVIASNGAWWSAYLAIPFIGLSTYEVLYLIRWFFEWREERW